MDKEESKGITAVIGIILLVAVAVILIVIIATFFIGFTTTTTQSVQSSAPKVQVLNAVGCAPNDGTVKLENTLASAIPKGTSAEITAGGHSYGLVRTTLSAIAAGSSAVIGFDYGATSSRPVYFPADQDVSITLKEGDARGQTASVTCAKSADWYTFDIDASSDNVKVKSSFGIVGAFTPNQTNVSDGGTSYNTTLAYQYNTTFTPDNITYFADRFDVWEGETQLNNATTFFCFDQNISNAAVTGVKAKLYLFDNTTGEPVNTSTHDVQPTTLDKLSPLDFKQGVMYTIKLRDSKRQISTHPRMWEDSPMKGTGTVAWPA